MSTRKIVVLICDLCGGDQLVETHRLTVDGHAVELEACDGCFAKIVKGLARAFAASRPVEEKIGRVSRKPGVAMPGTAWRFTSHALIRMGQRNLNPIQVVNVADNPELEHPGREDDGSVVRIAGALKVVCDVENRTIVTASLREAMVKTG